jgi:peptide-methionine (S)-S-oxide reductase
MFFNFLKTQTPIVNEITALKGRAQPLSTSIHHFISGRALKGPYPSQCQQVLLGMGCFWGAERLFWKQDGVWVTAVGYAGGFTQNPTYKEVCSGQTGHTEVVLVVFDPSIISFTHLLKLFFEGHDPTQGMRQGNDRGTQYRSVIYIENDALRAQAQAASDQYSRDLKARGYPPITTEITDAHPFYFAEDEHQQYLAKNPNGYCGLGGTGVSCSIG